jgi:DNA-binding NarL/FixJ family response regulator
VCSDERALDAVRREFVAAGWTPCEQGDCSSVSVGGRQLCVTRLETAADIATVVELLLRGVSVAAVATDPSLAADAFDQCRRIAVAEWFDRARPPIGDRLTDEQIELLVAIRNGADVEQAARRCHLSPRTAARRLTDARQSLGARSTAEAVSLVGRRIDELSGRA